MTVQNDMKRIAGIIVANAHKLENRSAVRIAERARALAPVRTGTLRASIRAVEGTVYSDDVVGVYQEFGTRKMSANPFWRPAIEEELPALAQDIANLLQKEF